MSFSHGYLFEVERYVLQFFCLRFDVNHLTAANNMQSLFQIKKFHFLAVFLVHQMNEFFV
jgi:hypothetical protein